MHIMYVQIHTHINIATNIATCTDRVQTDMVPSDCVQTDRVQTAKTTKRK